MGTYRFFLAALVVVSHCGLPIFGFNPGVVAVISFYILSGYVMTKLIRRYYAAPDRTTAFYADRSARLFPQFLCYLTITLILLGLGAIQSDWISDVTAAGFMANALILPLNFYMPPALDLGHSMLIPQAWSLGLEMTFYLVIPFVLHHTGTRGMVLVCAMSMGVFLAAATGLIHSDYFGYRLLPGTLFMFLAGVFLAGDGHRPKVAAAGILLSALLFGAYMIWGQPVLLKLPYNKEVILGVIIGVPMVAILSRLKSSALDENLGNLSYGLFLNHFIFIWLTTTWTSGVRLTWLHAAAIIGAGTLAALITYSYVERPALLWRRRLRYGVLASASRVPESADVVA